MPILINSFNRLSCLRRLIMWLTRAGYRRIYVIDNDSSYPPLLAFLAALEDGGMATVIRLAAMSDISQSGARSCCQAWGSTPNTCTRTPMLFPRSAARATSSRPCRLS